MFGRATIRLALAHILVFISALQLLRLAASDGFGSLLVIKLRVRQSLKQSRNNY